MFARITKNIGAALGVDDDDDDEEKQVEVVPEKDGLSDEENRPRTRRKRRKAAVAAAAAAASAAAAAAAAAADSDESTEEEEDEKKEDGRGPDEEEMPNGSLAQQHAQSDKAKAAKRKEGKGKKKDSKKDEEEEKKRQGKERGEAEEDEEELKRRRKEMLEKLERSKRPANSWAESREKWQALWSAFKTFVLFLFLSAALVVYFDDYDRKPCRVERLGSGASFCLADFRENINISGVNVTVRFECVGVDDQVNGQSCGVNFCYGGEGCIKQVTPSENFTECIISPQMFLQRCEDPFTCLDSDEEDVKQAVLLIALLVFFHLACEASLTVALYKASEMTAEDFESPGGGIMWRFFIPVIKLAPRATRVLALLMILAEIYLAFTTNVTSKTCGNAVTSTGNEYQFFSDVRNFSAAFGGLLVGFLVIGTMARRRWLLRGELYTPKMKGSEKVPCGLCDCGEWTARESPRCCPNFCKEIRGLCPAACIWLPACLSFVIEAACTPVFYCGRFNRWLWAQREDVGP